MHRRSIAGALGQLGLELSDLFYEHVVQSFGLFEAVGQLLGLVEGGLVQSFALVQHHGLVVDHVLV